ncbi:MAG: aminotransferase class III-fold pyridoxal phosphate-dependent enzyme [Acidobacteria bacterium]|nr:aminotransferase class III-fold pyridoxal phosphate-dependent enzyme [Acidobacteriota bacterium]
MRGLRDLTRERGAVLIFDEVVTGFRMAPGGAQESLGVTADLACFAKALAGGLPGAALAGRADIMEAMAFTGDPSRDRRGRVADQGTHSAMPVVAAAGIAALEILKTGDVQRRLNRLGDRLRDGLNAVLERRGIPGFVYGGYSVFRIFLGDTRERLGLTGGGAVDHARLDRGMGPLGAPLHLAMLLNGVDYSRGLATGWLNAAMTDADIDQVVEAFDRSAARLLQSGDLAIGRLIQSEGPASAGKTW